MAKIIELTNDDGNKIYLNADRIFTVKASTVENRTEIYVENNVQYLELVQETAAQIMALVNT